VAGGRRRPAPNRDERCVSGSERTLALRTYFVKLILQNR
jgi:hypothetical protein